ncbi:MAG: ABC transporter ATP-binding protein [Clostridia bacterium]|nr:ABC transporter ATP-binding protein [Clostridia bacterium]
MIEVKHLTKKYGNHTAVRDLSFNIDEGKIYGLLGPNGAGKSTTMNIITGCLAATSGQVLVNGHDIFEEPLEAKACIGYLPELPPLYEDMTPKEYLVFVAEAKRVPYEKSFRQIRDIMRLTGLTDVGNRLIRNLSKGYRQRVGIAQAMIGDPDIIILDEPTVGLDPKQIIEIRELIKSLGKIKTVVISSHILAEISEICDHVLIISEGRLVADESLGSLEETAIRENGLVVKLYSSSDEVRKVLSRVSCAKIEEIGEENGIVTVRLTSADCDSESEDLRRNVAGALAEARLPVMEIRYPTLESIFLELTQKQNDGEEEEEYEGTDKSAFQKVFGKKKSGSEEYTPIFDDYKPLFSSSDDADEEDAEEGKDDKEDDTRDSARKNGGDGE